MINIDFSVAIALYSVLFLGLALLAWMGGKKQKDRELTLDPKFIWFCSVCTYTYINTKEDVISLCPRCGNYNKK